MSFLVDTLDASPDSEHMEILVAALSKKGAAYWNDWCAAHPSVRPNLAGIEFAVANTIRGVPLESICLAMIFLARS